MLPALARDVGPLPWTRAMAIGWPVIGTGAGMALMAALTWQFGLVEAARLPLVQAIAGLLTAAGTIAMWRGGVNAAAQLPPEHRHWLRRSRLAAVGLSAATLVAYTGASRLIAIAAAIVALIVLYFQCMSLRSATTVPAWRARGAGTLVVASAMLEGVGLLAIVDVLTRAELDARPVAACLVVLGIAAALAFARYRFRLEAAELDVHARHAIDSIATPVHASAHAMPVVLAGWVLVSSSAEWTLLVIAGAGTLVGGLLLKYRLLTGAARLRIPG